MHLNKVDEAETAARKANEAAPELAAGQSALAEVYFRQARFPEAEAIVKKLIREDTSDARAYLTLGRIYDATANHKAAKSSIDAAHKLDNNDPDVYFYWLDTLPRSERLVEIKRLLVGGVPADEKERKALLAEIALAEDQEKQPVRTCRLTAKNLPMETKVEPLLEDAYTLRGYGLYVRVNDTSSKLLIDTGSTGILINSKIAEKAGVTRIADQQIGGIGDEGAASGYLGFAQKLQIGSLTFEDCYVDVVDKKSSLGEDGLIGMDIFADFLVDLDFPDKKLRLSELPPFPDVPLENQGLQLNGAKKNELHNRWIPPQFSSFEHVYRIGHFLLIPGQINDSPPKLFLLDTGAHDNELSLAAAKSYARTYSVTDEEIKGLSGKVKKVYITGDVTLTFGHFRQRRYDLFAFDHSSLSDSAGTEISGLLGFVMLYMLDIKIDYRDQLVNFSYDPGRFY